MKGTQDESAALKRKLDSATLREREQIAHDFPLEFDEWCAEVERDERQLRLRHM